MKKLKMKKMRKTVKSKLKDLYVKLSLAVFFAITNLQLAYADEDEATATGADAKYNTVMGFIGRMGCKRWCSFDFYRCS